MKPLNGRVILKKINEKKKFKGIIIPQQAVANQITFAKVVMLPDEPLDTTDLQVNDYVVLGYSPIWNKKYNYKIEDEEYLVVNEYSILAIVKDAELLNMIDTEEC